MALYVFTAEKGLRCTIQISNYRIKCENCRARLKVWIDNVPRRPTGKANPKQRKIEKKKELQQNTLKQNTEFWM